jgi:hypothetical protein
MSAKRDDSLQVEGWMVTKDSETYVTIARTITVGLLERKLSKPYFLG